MSTTLTPFAFISSTRALRSGSSFLHGTHQPVLAGYWALARDRNHQRALALMAAMVLGAFTLFVHMPAYLTANCGWSDGHLQLLYMVGGPFTLVMVNVAGRLADRFGKLLLFRILALSDQLPKTGNLRDGAHERVFVEQLKNFAEPEDVGMGICADGNSLKIVNAVEYAAWIGCHTIAVTASTISR